MSQILEVLSSNKAWIFEGIGVFILAGIASFFAYFFRGKRQQDHSSSVEQTSGDNAVNIQGGANVSVGSIFVQSNQVPPSLAKPNFLIKQVGFWGVSNKSPEYTFELTNGGGDCLSVRVSSDIFVKEWPVFKRGHSRKFHASIKSGSEPLSIIISGRDANGNEYRKVFQGIRYTSGYEFS